MKNQRKFFIVSLIFLCLLVSLASVSAEDLNTISDGEVSGDVDVVVTNPWDTSGELSYEIPDDVKDVDYAGLYVNVYSGKAAPTNGAESNVSMTCNGETEQIASEQLVSTEGSSDATVYTINDHTTKNYADFQMIYDITDKLQGKTGTITFNVTNSKIDGYDFDGRIKLIGLVFAYNDGDDDKVSYWVNSGQSWTKTDSKSTFDVGTIENEISKATIDNVALSSSDGRYTFNDDVLEATEHASGSYYQYNQFDVKDKVVNGTNTLIYAYNGTSAYGSFKNVLSVLTVQALPSVSADVALTGEYSAAVAYAGTENVVKVTVTNDGEKSTDYVVDFYVDGAKVSSDNLTIAKGEKAVLLVTDDTIRPVTEKTVNGAENDKVNYTVIVSEKDGAVLAEATITPSILYDGYLGKDYAYPAENITLFNTVAINGDIIIDTKDASTYLGAATTNRTDVWAIDIAADAVIVNAYVYVPYNWNKYGMPMAWNCTFNGANIVAVATYKDQSNLGSYGKHDYGLFVYDVSDLIADGDNEFVLNKEFNQTAVYPSTLVILYNETSSDTIKTVYMFNGADLLTASSYNLANRVVSSDSIFDVDAVDDVTSATLYVFAAGAQAGEGNLIVNGVESTDVWNGTSQTTDLVEVDLTDSLAESNAVSFVSTGGTILAIQQFVVVEVPAVASASVALACEYSAAAAYAGTENVVKVTVTNDGEKTTDYVVKLFVDGAEISSEDLTLAVGDNEVLLVTDETIRPVTEKTVNGAENDKVNYTAIVSEKDGAVLAEATITPSILYDGYLGKDYAYPAENITLFNTVTINGEIVAYTMDASTYLGAATTNRTDVWNVDIADDAVIVNAYVYVPYNWNKYGIPMAWNCTFNGANITAVATYKDQSNLGTYGKHDYGLFVYDVSDLIADGDNEFVLNKEFNQTAVYPSTLVILYNFTTADTIQTVYMFNGADLLTASSYNLANRVVSSNSVLDVDDVENVYNAKLYVFAAGAQAGEGNLIVNGEEFTDVWSGTSQTTDLVEVDLTDSLAESNTVSFVATGSTILALQQFVVVEYYGTAADLQEIIDDAEPGATIDLGDRAFKDISNVNITKDVAITGGTIIGSESADSIFVIAPKSENGPGEVNITGVEFKVNNANTIVKATGENATDDVSIDVPAINIKDNTIEFASDDVVAESINVLELDSERPVLSPTNDIAISGNTIAAGINPFEFEVTSVASGDDVSIVPQKIVPEKKATVIVYENMTTTALGPSDGRSGEYFYFNLTDADGNPIANTPMQIGFNGKIYDYEHNNISTDENGTAKLQINLGYKGDYTFAICFLGDDDYNASFAVAVIKVGTQQPKLNVPNKSYSASAKTKTLTATFLTDKGNPIAGKSIKFTVNGKTYSAKTNDNGVATVKVSLNKKGTYNFTVKYGGDSTYAAVTQKAKLTIK